MNRSATLSQDVAGGMVALALMYVRSDHPLGLFSKGTIGTKQIWSSDVMNTRYPTVFGNGEAVN